MKKFISIFVSAVMICSLCAVGSFSAFATETAEPDVNAPCVVFGDVDEDGVVDAVDAREILRASVNLVDFNDTQMARADLDLDGSIKAKDARFVLRLSVELEEQPSHVEVIDEAKAATFAVSGLTEGSHCKVCGTVFTEAEKVDSTLETVVAAANAWAESAGIDGLVAGTAEDNKAAVILNVDGIWADDVAFNASAFDGFLTKLGEAVDTYLGEDDSVTIDGNEVFKGGKLQNTAVKTALFDIGAGFFYKVANLKADGVFGTYAVKVNDEDIALTVSFAGSETNINKVKSFCQTISEHISAEVIDNNLEIDVIAPDALKNAIIERAGEDAEEKLNNMTIGAGLLILGSYEADEIFGSQASAVNKLCGFICQLSPFVNKVLSKTEAYVVTNTGEEIPLNVGEFDCGGDCTLAGLVAGVQGVLSDELLDTTVGSFLGDEGYYRVPVLLSVDMSSLGLMQGEVIEETVYVNIHLW